MSWLRAWGVLMVGAATATVYTLILELVLQTVNPEHLAGTRLFLNLLTGHGDDSLALKLIMMWFWGPLLAVPVAVASTGHGFWRVARFQVAFAVGLFGASGLVAGLVFLLDPVLMVPHPGHYEGVETFASLAMVRADVTWQALSLFGWGLGPLGLSAYLGWARFGWLARVALGASLGGTAGVLLGVAAYWTFPIGYYDLHIAIFLEWVIVGALIGAGAGAAFAAVVACVRRMRRGNSSG